MTFTKEQLIAAAVGRIEMAEETLANDLVPLARHTFEIDLELARIALASLEAESVAWVIEGGNHDTPRHISTKKEYAEAYPDRVVTPLYTAPPAPVSVPDEVLKSLLPDVEKSEFWFEHNGKTLFEGVKFNNAVFEACRAAMLQGAENAESPTTMQTAPVLDSSPKIAKSRCSNSPLIQDEGDNTPPHQGWVFTHGGKDYFYRKQSDAVTHLNAAIESGGGASLIAVIAEPVTTAYKLRDAVNAIRNSGIEIDGEKILAERNALNSPVIPDGWVILPAEPTQAMMNAWLSEVANWRGHASGYRAMIAAAPQQEVKP